MGKRRGWRTGERDFIFDVPVDENTCVATASLSKRLRRQRRKLLRKHAKQQFDTACGDLLTKMSEPDSEQISLPLSIQTCTDPDTLTLLSSLVNAYLDTFDLKETRAALARFYCDDAYLTLQFAPHLSKGDVLSSGGKKIKFKTPYASSAYEPFACNLIPGALPLPSWAWAQMSTAVAALPKSKRPNEKLEKCEKQRLKALRTDQAWHIRRLEIVTRSSSAATNNRLPNVPFSPLARSAARGKSEIIGLLVRLPDLVHLKVDECCCLDVVLSESTAICFRYSCLGAEPVTATDEELSAMIDDPILSVDSLGPFFIRAVHRLLLVCPNSDGGIIQEDVCFTPAPHSLIQQYASVITNAISERLSLRNASVQPGTTEHSKETLVKHFSTLTKMNAAYSLQCLSECGFDLQTALDSFHRVLGANLLPADAFIDLPS
ncbi:TAP protein [Paragonimus heterotremus]|uniref:TAP protein n=1 Tax=Paragonimus heterotremus TaxID=100268 RepID=A0A8J4SJQ2_9TREM|nr:TAP protein [Paragonimus heterotremus]